MNNSRIAKCSELHHPVMASPREEDVETLRDLGTKLMEQSGKFFNIKGALQYRLLGRQNDLCFTDVDSEDGLIAVLRHTIDQNAIIINELSDLLTLI